MAEAQISIVIPMFNEAARIRESLTALASSRVGGAEFVLVDDGSADETASVADRALADLGLDGQVLHRAHAGKGAATIAGLAGSSGAVVAYTDADLSADVDSIERVIDIAICDQADAVFASRRHPDSVIEQHQPLGRELAGRSFNLVLRALRLTKLKDTQCGLKAFSRPAADLLVEHSGVSGFGFDVGLEVILRAHGIPVVEAPVNWHHEDGSAVRVLAHLPSVGRDVFDVLQLRRSLNA